MSPEDLQNVLSTLWMWIAAPAAGIAALVLTIRLAVPQVIGLPEAFRAMREDDPKAPGTIHPATSVAMGAVTSYGAAAAVGAATAIALGGPGAIAWVWLFAIVLAPLRMGEAILARTAPVGQPGESTGSLAGRLLDDPIRGLRVLGWALVVLVPVTGFAFYGGTHGSAVLDAAEQLLPGSALTLGLTVAVVAGVLALIPTEKIGSILGWLAAVSLLALVGAALVALGSEPGRGIAGIGRALQDAFYDTPGSGAFSGALAGEIAMASVLYLLPPLAAGTGVEGAWHAEAQAKTTRGQAKAALLGTIVYGLVTTVVGLSLVATNAFARPVDDSRTMREVRFYRAAFDTVSQREEPSRFFSGIIRIQEGATGVVEINPGTERGMILTPRFEEDGEPADVMLRVSDGVVIEIHRPGTMGALELAPDSAFDRVTIHGRMLPRGGRLIAESMSRGGGSITSRVSLAALLLLALLGAVGWGFGVRKTLAAKLPEKVARFTAMIPAAGLALAALGVVRDFSSWGLVAAALLTTVSAMALIVRGKEISRLVHQTRTAPARTAQAEAPPRAKSRAKKRKKKRKA